MLRCYQSLAACSSEVVVTQCSLVTVLAFKACARSKRCAVIKLHHIRCWRCSYFSLLIALDVAEIIACILRVFL